MVKEQTVPQQLAYLARSIDELQIALARSSVQILSPVIAETTEHIRQQVTALDARITEYEHSISQLRGLTQINQVVNSSLEIESVLEAVMDNVIHLTGAERGFLMLKDKAGKYKTRIGRNWEKDTVNEKEEQVSRSIIRRVLDDGKPVMTTNAQEDPRFTGQESIIAYNLRSILCVPLKVIDETVGVIYTDHRIQSGIFTEADRETVMTFADQAAIALENARLYESVQASLADANALKNLMESVFTSITSGVITTDENRKVIFCNPSARKMLNVQPGLHLKAHLDAKHPELSARLSPYIDLVQDHQEPISGIELTPHGKNQTELDLRFAISPLRDLHHNKVRGLTIVMEDQTEKKHLQAQHRLFEKMVSPVVIKQLNPDTIQLGGSRTLLSILFADISGYTRLSQSVSPETLVSVVNCYLTAAAEAVLSMEGTIDKFLGDSVMAWFNAPIPQPDHALRVVRAAWRIKEAIPLVHCKLPEPFQLQFSMGIHTGDAILGMIGSEKRMEYTAVGDSVNVAKRLQEAAVSGQILLSGDTYKEIDTQVIVKRLDPLLLRGRSSTLEIYELLGVR